MKRLLGLVCLLAAALVAFSVAFRVNAAATDFQIVGVGCNSNPTTVSIQNVSGATSTLDNLALEITPPTGGVPTILSINAHIQPVGIDYAVVAGGTVILQIGQGAAQNPTPAGSPLAAGQVVALTTNALLAPGSIVQLFDTGSGNTVGSAVGCQNNSAKVFIVSPVGFDFIDLAQTQPNTTCGSDLPANTPPTPQNPGPCLTIDHALQYAQDGDTIYVDFGFYEVCHPIELSKLVRITTRQSALKGQTFFGATMASGDAVTGAVLHSFTGDPVFHVTAVGYPSASSPGNLTNSIPNNQPAGTLLAFVNHAAIDGLRLGGSFKPGAAAVVLDDDAYTDITNDWFGGDAFNNTPSSIAGSGYTGIPCAQPQPFPPTLANPLPTQKQEIMGNSAAIMLKNSDHANIFNNAILGSSDFKYAPILATGAVQTGFGIVTSECLGQGPDASNAATIAVNTISRNQNAAIWLCSDGGGGHQISQNAVRSNGRGIVLRAVTSTLLDANTIGDDYEDGIVVYDASSNNTIQRNVIESNRTPGAAGIRVGGFGASLFPLQTAINSNTLRRNWTGIDIAGARNTTGTGNVISSEDARTAILLQVGAAGSPSVTQPVGTSFEKNQIVSNGGCASTRGCAIRLDQYVTSDVDAQLNDFGLPALSDVNSVLWHKPNDPSLGYIAAANNPGAAVQSTPAPGIGAPGAVGGGFVQAAFAVTPAAGAIAGAPGASISVTGPAAAALAAAAGTGTPAPGAAPAGAGAASAAGPAPAVTPQPVATASAPTVSGAPGGPLFSPPLTLGAANGNSTYTPGPNCSLVIVPAEVGTSVQTDKFLSFFQPVTNIFSAWVFNNTTRTYQSIYFADPAAPVDAAVLRPGNIISLCLVDSVTGPAPDAGLGTASPTPSP